MLKRILINVVIYTRSQVSRRLVRLVSSQSVNSLRETPLHRRSDEYFYRKAIGPIMGWLLFSCEIWPILGRFSGEVRSTLKFGGEFLRCWA